jgi:glycosyltransferase involved in cell wall biosynthesis
MKATAGTTSLEILNLSDSTLVALSGKGNIGYVEELYNPLNYFHCVHHISFFKDDRDVKLENPTIKTHVLRRVRPRIPLLGVIIVTIVYLFQIICIARRNKICLIRGRAPYYASLLGLIISKLLRIPLAVSIGGNHRLANDLEGIYPFDSKFWSEWVETRVLKGANKVICPNQYSRNYVLDIGVSPKKAVVIPLRLKDDVFNFNYKYSSLLVDNGVHLDKPIVLFVGRFTLDKQVDVFIETIPLISAVCPNVQFVLIGDGPLKPKLEQRVDELGEKQRVFFLGFQPMEVIKYCLNAATAVCIPMSGFVIYEAAAAGKPIVAFDVEWHSEFIKDGQTGLLVENRNREKLAQSIKRLINEPQLAQSLGRNARNFIDTEYNPQTLAKKEIAELLEIIKKK